MFVTNSKMRKARGHMPLADTAEQRQNGLHFVDNLAPESGCDR